MPQTKNQVFIIGIAGFVILVFVLIWLRVLPGRPTDADRPENVRATLSIWGVFRSTSDYDTAKNEFNAKYNNVIINFRNFTDTEDYEFTLIDALAAGRGPDIFIVPNASLEKYLTKISPAPLSLSLFRLRSLFPDVVEKSFYRNGYVYALPLSIDTLALIYNKDLFNQAALINPPATWDEVEIITPRLVKKDANGALIQAAIALGGSSNIHQSPHILEFLMMQNNILDESGRNQFSSGSPILDYYLQYSSPSIPLYTWNNTMPFSTDLISQGRLAMILDYGRSAKELRDRNQFLNLRTAPAPQVNQNQALAYANMWGYTVSNQSRNAVLAWELLETMTANPSIAESYFLASGDPPALNSLIQKYLSDPDWSAYAKQALIAKTWPKLDSVMMDRVISDAIQNAANGVLSSADALKTVDVEYGRILGRIVR